MTRRAKSVARKADGPWTVLTTDGERIPFPDIEQIDWSEDHVSGRRIAVRFNGAMAAVEVAHQYAALCELLGVDSRVTRMESAEAHYILRDGTS